MEFRVDIVGDTDGADRGAAALREEALAARDTSAALARFGDGKAMAAAYADAKSLAEGLKAARREVSSLKAAKSALGSSKFDLEATKAINEQIKAARTLANEKAAALAKTGLAGVDFAGSEAKTKAAAAEREKRAKAASSEQEKDSKKFAASAEKTSSKIKELAKGALAYGAALAGIHGLYELTTMAIGWRTMGHLQMLSWRATMDIRRAVKDTDAQPLVRAFTRLESNLSKSTITGAALSGILTRGFNAFFGGVERVGPMLEGVFQYGVLGALKLESAWLDVRLETIPLTSALGSLGEELDKLDWSDDGASTWASTVEEIRGIADAAAGAVAKLNAVLRDFRESGAAQLQTNAKRNLGMISEGEYDRQRRENLGGKTWSPKGGGEGFAAVGPGFDPGAAGRGTGKALGEGIVKGLDETAPAVAAAGARSANTANQAARNAVGAHSPADATIKLGRDMGAGQVVGLDQSRPAIEAAGARNLGTGAIPGAPGGGKGAGGAGLTIGALIGSLTIEMKGGASQDMRAQLLAMAPDLAQEILRILSARLGLPILGIT